MNSVVHFEMPYDDAGRAAAFYRSAFGWNTEALGTTDEALMKAIQVVGTRIDRIKEYLGSGGMAADQEDA